MRGLSSSLVLVRRIKLVSVTLIDESQSQIRTTVHLYTLVQGFLSVQYVIRLYCTSPVNVRRHPTSQIYQ